MASLVAHVVILRLVLGLGVGALPQVGGVGLVAAMGGLAVRLLQHRDLGLVHRLLLLAGNGLELT